MGGRLITVLAVVAVGASDPGSVTATDWRIVNAAEVEVAWRVRTLQFFTDSACTEPVDAVEGQSGEAFGTEAAEMTGASYAFALRSPRGWETLDECAAGSCHLGFRWKAPVTVGCVLFHQGELGFHTSGLTLQANAAGPSSAWQDVATWEPIDDGRVKLSLSCPAPPVVPHGNTGDCQVVGPRSQRCPLTCAPGFGAVEQRLQCIHGVWYAPECLPVGTLLRVVAQEPEMIKPYWVVLHATLYVAADCTDVIRMDGTGISSGEYVIKYANYHAKNVWDGDASSSWASATPCTPGECYFGFRFHRRPPVIRCLKIEHPDGSQYHADRVTVEQLGESGWEEMEGLTVRLLPEKKQEL